MLGEGPERAALETLAGSLGVRERLLLPGRVGDVAALYRRADVVVHPARWEGFGLAMLEAMLAAKPVVAARAGSAPELVADGETGVLVPVDDADGAGRGRGPGTLLRRPGPSGRAMGAAPALATRAATPSSRSAGKMARADAARRRTPASRCGCGSGADGGRREPATRAL